MSAREPVASDAAPERPSRRLVAVLALAVLALAVVGYWQTGSPSLARPGAASANVAAAEAPAAGASASSSMQQIAAMVDKLAERMKQNPTDAEGWVMLARSYAVLGRIDEALPAYAHASELQPNNPTLLADYAGALAVTKGSADNPQSNALVERALKIDPKQPKALALKGTVAFEHADYATAIAEWQKIADQLPPGSELGQRVQASIAEARQRRDGRGAASAAVAGAKPGDAGTKSATNSAANASVSGVVTLDPALAAQAAPGDSLFVFARAASGGRMPLAVLRATVKDLPLTFTLDDSMAMAPGMTLSSVPQVVVGARISKSGNAIPQPGDLSGESAAVAPGAKNLAIRIASVVGKP